MLYFCFTFFRFTLLFSAPKGTEGNAMPNGKKAPKNLFKRGNTYYVRWRMDGKLKMQSTGETTLDAAIKKRDEILHPFLLKDEAQRLKSLEAAIGSRSAELKQLEDSAPALTIANAWTEYRKSHNRPRSGERTLTRYESCITAFNNWMKKSYSDVKEMRHVTTEHAEGYADHLEGKNLSPSSFNIYLNSLAMVWAVLEKKARIEHNPFAWDKKSRTGIQRKNIKAESTLRKKRALTLEEVNAVIEKAKGDYRTLLIVLACTGQRLADGVKLQWREIDFEKNIITLTPVKTAKRTGKQVYIPILPQLREELHSIMKRGRYVLPDLVKVYDRDRSAITKKIRSIFTKAELAAHKETDLKTGQAIVETGAHSLRHSFVTIARMAGFPDPLIMKITGHSSQEMINHYTAFNEKLVASLASQIPHALPKGNKGFLPKDASKEPLPAWAKKLIEKLSPSNCEKVKAELLA